MAGVAFAVAERFPNLLRRLVHEGAVTPSTPIAGIDAFFEVDWLKKSRKIADLWGIIIHKQEGYSQLLE